jgi:NDP-sugar pyrophosphorylase family protein
MRAMVLAAGLGTRLRPLTSDRPKALVTVAGRTLLEITLARLRSFGIRDVIINVHHYADLVVEYLESHKRFGMRIEISREEVLLDTGGGLKKAADFFLESDDPDEPFVLHNVDVISTIDFSKMLQLHTDQQAIATLATQHRSTARYLLFDQNLRLCGRQKESSPPEMAREVCNASAVGFCGIHIISPRLLREMQQPGSFSIIDTYLQLAAKGEVITTFAADQYYWRDLGKPESISAAESDYSKGLFE